MKTTSRILSMLLVLAMALAIVPVSTFAAAPEGELSFNTTMSDGLATEIVGIPEGANVTYLSDGAVELVAYQNLLKNATTATATINGVSQTVDVPIVRNNEAFYVANANNYKYVEGVRTKQSGDDLKKIILGYNAVTYAKGLGVLSGSKHTNFGPNGYENYLTYAVPEGATHFYAVTGNNGGNTTQTASNKKYSPIRFELWGGNSVDGEFTLLAYAECWAYRTGEFNVDITGYSYIKLVHKQAASATQAQGDLECVWANASVYSMPAAEVDTTAKHNVRFDSALSLLTSWNQAAYPNADRVEVSYKGNISGFGISTTTINNAPYWAVEFPGLSAKEMTENMTVSLMDANKEVLNAVTVSVRDYAMKVLDEGDNDACKTAVYHMLQFGAAAQNYFNYNTGAMANAGLADYESNAMTGEVSSEDVVERKVISGEGECFYGTNLRLEDRINLMFYFENLPAGDTAEITVNGKTVTKVVKDMGNGISMVEMDEIAVADYKAAVVCTILDGETEVVSVQDSIAGYAFRALEKNDKRAAVCSELLKYAESVTRYLRSKHNYNVTFTQPTCTEPAYRVFTCTDCGFCYQEVFDKVSANGHQWDGTNCTVCGNIPLPQYSGIRDAAYHSAPANYIQSYKYVYSDSNPKAYENSLKASGFKLIQENDINSNRFVTYIKEGILVHCSYFDADNEFRITSTSFTYTGATEPVNDYVAVVTPSISMIEIGGTGLAMVIQLADGSFVIIDGGFGQNTSTVVQNADMERLYKFLKDNTPNGGIPQITWMITHVDYDHIGLPTRFLNEYRFQIDVNTICYNVPSLGETSISNKDQLVENWLAFDAAMKNHVPNSYIMHTGSKLYLPGCEIEFLITAAEDLNPSDMTSGNHTSNAWRMTIAGKTILITGDIEEPLSRKMANNYGKYLASNILQVVHHGVNGATKQFNEYVASGTEVEGNKLEVCFWPIRTDRIWRTEEYPTINQPLWDSGADHYYHDYTTTLLLPDLTKK